MAVFQRERALLIDSLGVCLALRAHYAASIGSINAGCMIMVRQSVELEQFTDR